MKSNGYTLIELLILMGVVGLLSIVFLTKTSYAFTDNSDEYYNNIISLAIDSAKKYGETSKKLQEEKSEIITIGELVEKKYMGANEDGKVVDPRNENKNLNGIRILLKLNEDNNQITATVEK